MSQCSLASSHIITHTLHHPIYSSTVANSCATGDTCTRCEPSRWSCVSSHPPLSRLLIRILESPELLSFSSHHCTASVSTSRIRDNPVAGACDRWKIPRLVAPADLTGSAPPELRAGTSITPQSASHRLYLTSPVTWRFFSRGRQFPVNPTVPRFGDFTRRTSRKRFQQLSRVSAFLDSANPDLAPKAIRR